MLFNEALARGDKSMASTYRSRREGFQKDLTDLSDFLEKSYAVAKSYQIEMEDLINTLDH